MREIQIAVVVGRQGGQLEGVADGGPLLGEVVHVRDDPQVLEDHLGALPLEAIRPVARVKVLQDVHLGAQRPERGDGRGKVVLVEVLGGPGRGDGRREVVVEEGVLKGDCVVAANGAALLLEAHDDGLGRVGVEEGKDVQQDLLVAEARVAVGVVDVQRVVAQPRADVEVAQPALQLHAQVPVLALQLLVANVVRHGVVRAGDAEARQVHVVGDRGHPRGMQLVGGVEAVHGLVAAIAGCADHAGRDRDEQVEERHGADEADGDEEGELAPTTGGRGRNGERDGAHCDIEYI